MRPDFTLVPVLALIALPALSDTTTALRDHALPAHERVAAETSALARKAAADCAPDAVRPAYHDAYDAWIGVSHVPVRSDRR
jgi:hypothetical protein